jgi:hypothetical protein
VTPRRRLLANAVILAILGGQAAAIVTGRELWPFSPYAMYSNLRRGPTISRLWVVGVSEGGAETPLHGAMLHPFRFSQLEAGLGRLDGEVRREGLSDLLRRYEVRRLAGRHAGPALEALRLYRMTFDAAADGDRRPLARDLLAEVRR